MHFRRKPVEVQAVQLLWSTWGEMCSFADVGMLRDGKPEACYVDSRSNDRSCRSYRSKDTDCLGLWIPSIEGLVLAVETDWIIREKGKLYPCKADVFAAMYEEVLIDNQVRQT